MWVPSAHNAGGGCGGPRRRARYEWDVISAPATGHTPRHVPAAGIGWMLPAYDPICHGLGITRAHRRLLTHARVGPGHRVLDVGCGTGILTIETTRAQPEAAVIGLDPDPAALDRVRSKTDALGMAVHLDVGFGGALPYADGTFERVLSSFVIHHLLGEERMRALAEIRRVLASTGSLHVVDFGGGADLAHDLQVTGFRRGRLTRGRVMLALPMTIVDAYP